MDRVRFGRALGYGARHAAKTLAQMAEAASTPSDSPGKVEESGARTTSAGGSRVGRPAAAVGTAVKAAEQARRAGGSAFSSVKGYSRTVMLQVAGTFFALIAVGVGRGIWILHWAAFAAPASADAQKLYALMVVFGLFVYFAVSSFARAGR
jgi:hypothetical protein